MASGVSRTLRAFSFLLFVGLVCSFGVRLAAAQTSTALQPPARITGTVDDARRVVLSGNVHPLAQGRYDQGEAPQSTATGRIQLVLQRSPAQQQALAAYLSDVQNPGSPNYHKWLTPAQFGSAFGISDADLQTVETWLQGKGFKVERVAQARNVVLFSGTLGQLASAFHTSIHSFVVNGEAHLANVGNPQIPAALASVVSAVGPLHNFRPVSQARFAGNSTYDTSSHSIRPDLTLFGSTGTPYLYVNPADAATIYDTPNAALNPNYTGPTYDGTGINIGMVGDSNITLQDVTNYRVAFLGESATTAKLPTVVIDGPDPGLTGDQGEALLDTEIAGALAPQASLYLYIANNSDLQTGVFDAFVRALDDNEVSILNMSFGECEAGLGTAGNTFLQELMQQAAAQGISVTVSSGDSGAAGCDSSASKSAAGGLAVNGLASSPYDIAVGGTDYNALADNFATYANNANSGTAPYYRTASSYIPERPWNDSTSSNEDLASNSPFVSGGSTNVVAAGGGLSSCVVSTSDSSDNTTCQSGYAKPAFQSALTPADGARDVPDVSFLAANGLYQAVWVVCADNVANGTLFPVYTNCETENGAFTSTTTFSGYGGTSAAAPAMAGILALVEQKTGSRIGQADYTLYKLAQTQYGTVFHDVTDGNNSVVCTSGATDCGTNGFLTGYNATTGYDLASGLGSIDAAQLVNQWANAGLTATSTNLTINGSTAAVNVVHGTTLSFEAAIAPSSATGTVGIVDNANETETGPKNNGQTLIQLAGGSGSTTYNGLPGGSYAVYGFYSGDTADAASTSNGIPVTISAEDSTTALTVDMYAADGASSTITDLSNVPYGSYVLAYAQILGKAEGTNTQGIATGTVSITDNGTTLASDLPLNGSNTTEYETPTTAHPTAFALGAHSLAASYVGDASYKASTSTPVNFTVVKGGTFIHFTAGSTTISSLASTQFTVGIDTTSLGSYPTGTLTLTLNGAPYATITSFTSGGGSNGADESAYTFALQGSSLAAGANTIGATYSGDSNYTGSTGSVAITVIQAAFTLANSGAITVAPGATSENSSTITASPTNSFTGVIDLSCSISSSPAGATSLPTCSIPSTVNITGTASVSANLQATTTTSTTPGAYVITVTGVDGTTGKVTASTAVNLTVTGTAPAASFSLANSGGITVNPGATAGNTSTITVTPANGFTGTVNLSCAVTTSIANPTSAPTCTVPSTVAITGTTSATATLTVSTTASTSAMLRVSHFGLPGVALAALLFLWVPARRRRALRLLALLVLLASTYATGCGGASSKSSGAGSNGTSAGTYTVTVTGIDAATGKISASTAVTVTVN